MSNLFLPMRQMLYWMFDICKYAGWINRHQCAILQNWNALWYTCIICSLLTAGHMFKVNMESCVCFLYAVKHPGCLSYYNEMHKWTEKWISTLLSSVDAVSLAHCSWLPKMSIFSISMSETLFHPFTDNIMQIFSPPSCKSYPILSSTPWKVYAFHTYNL